MTRTASWSIDRGRQFELDKIDTGRAQIEINDTDGTFDPTNPSSPYWDSLTGTTTIQPLKPVAIALQNPVTLAHKTLFRGHTTSYDYKLEPSQNVMRLTIDCADALELLSDAELTPGIAGDAPPVGSENDVFYEEAEVDDRVIQVLADYGFASDMWTRSGSPTIFAGNVVVQDSIYSPGEKYLTVAQDAADAEFPVANFYVDKEGLFTFHGRFARFDPTATAASSGGAWQFRQWACGDGPTVVADPAHVVQLRGMEFTRDKESVRNAALATPMHFDEPTEGGATANQVTTDPGSISKYGVRSWSAENLLTYGAKTGPNVGTGLWGEGGAQREVKLYADYIVQNYADPQNRLSALTFRPIAVGDSRAAALWDLMCNVELGDTIDVTVTHPGGGGIADTYYIEGIHYQCEPGGSVPDITLTLDVSPSTFYAANPF